MLALIRSVTRTHRCGVQLYQFSSGLDGLSFGNGVLVEGTEEAMRAELEDVFAKMRGEEGRAYGQNMKQVREMMSKSRENGGTKEAMLAMSKWFGEPA